MQSFVAYGQTSACQAATRGAVMAKMAPRGGSAGRMGGPVVRRGLALGQLLGGAETGGHRGRRARHVLVVVDAEQADPALLAEGQRDRAAELDQLRLGEVGVQPVPKA